MSAPAFRLESAERVAPATLHAAFGEAFADYLIGPFEVALAAWPGFLARQAVDLGLSRVALGDERPLAFAFVAPRATAGRWRLATMGALPSARGSGAAAALLDDFIARAGSAGCGAVELEVFAQNTRAVRLYEGRGFVARHGLHGWRRAADAGLPTADPSGVEAGAAASVTQAEALDRLRAWDADLPELPLQVTAAVVAVLTGAWQAWRWGQAQLVFSGEPPGPLTVHSLIDTSAGQVDGQALLRAWLRDHPGRAVQVPQLQRDDLGGAALQRLGFERQPLHQWWMRRAL
jgi:ribosomal protein S18 acetylase RimI-like enzyme